ncbi:MULTISPECIES: glycoside hydrolase family 3 C-terminal domain-containing protein [unclassified Bradyrhizobium]
MDFHDAEHPASPHRDAPDGCDLACTWTQLDRRQSSRRRPAMARSHGAAALAAVLFGDVNPSGRLPVTCPAKDENLDASMDRCSSAMQCLGL